ncbi:MAG TPA: TetR/AcrR family transcriptional regulator [Bryobacteraceae bacterium]
MPPEKRATDRRIQKTRKLLHDALMSLVREKPYDDIVVKEILDRANVGRSTFYTHFNDKDELLASGMQDLLRTVQAAELSASGTRQERIIRFSLPVFEHIHRHREAGAAGMGARGRAVLHERLQKVLAGLIADDIRKALQSRRKAARQTPPELLAQYVASTFVLVLNWWVENKSAMRPKDVDGLFRALTLPTLSASLE